jgi:hypothetical protein
MFDEFQFENKKQEPVKNRVPVSKAGRVTRDLKNASGKWGELFS